MPDDRADVLALSRDTVREAARSWRLLAALLAGFAFALVERATLGRGAFVFGPLAALYVLFLAPLPWRALVPLEADGQRVRKLVAWALASSIALCLAAMLVPPYVALARVPFAMLVATPRDLALPAALFLVTGWGLARDVQLEQRLDRSLRRHGQLTAELEEARLYALRADLDPHFLFNALNAIASQCASEPLAAEENIVRLSSLLRAVLDTRQRPLHALDEELALARDYLGLLAARYPQLHFRVVHEASLGQLAVPPLLLQPLLENAVRHGAIDAGEIVLSVRDDGPNTLLEVRSPGIFRGVRDGGMGLELVRRRVEIAWSTTATFTIGTDADSTLARIVVPRSTA